MRYYRNAIIDEKQISVNRGRTVDSALLFIQCNAACYLEQTGFRSFSYLQRRASWGCRREKEKKGRERERERDLGYTQDRYSVWGIQRTRTPRLGSSG